MQVNAEAFEPEAGDFDPDAVGELLGEGERFHRYAADAGWFGSKIAKAVGKAAKIVVKQVAKHDPLSNAIRAAASGGNIGKALLASARQLGADVKTVAPYASMIAAQVPGIGTGLSAAIGTGMAFAQGKGLSAAVLAGVKGALPGGPLAAAAFDSAMTLAKGGSLTDAALSAARGALPGGEAAQKAFDAAVALAHGASLQKVAIDSAISALPGGQFGDVAKRLAAQVAAGTPVVDAIKSTGSEAALRAASRSLGLELPTAIKSTADMARSIIVRPELHSASPWELASHFGVGGEDAKRALALALAGMHSIGQGARPKFGAAGLEEDAGRLYRSIGPRTTFHAAMPQIASYAAPSMRGPSPTHHLAPRFRRRLFGYAAGLEAAGLTSNGTGWLVESGDFPSKIAQIVTGSAGRYPELLDANPSKAKVRVYKMPDGSYLNVPDNGGAVPAEAAAAGVVYQGRNFASLQPGETLTLPASWIKAAPAPTPTPKPAPGGDPVTSTMSDTDILAIKTKLVLWGSSTGLRSPSDYGQPVDMMPPIGWTQRDTQCTAAFQTWFDTNRSGNLRIDGYMDAATLAALNAWAQAASSPQTPPVLRTPPAVPQTPPVLQTPPALPAIPNVIPPVTPAVPAVVAANKPAPAQPTQAQIAAAKKSGDGLALTALAMLLLAA